VYRASDIYPQGGFSVRCVRDSDTGSCFDPEADGICAEDEVSGCTDSTASNFNPEATEEDNSCEFPVPTQCGGQSTVTFDGYTYDLEGIGSQCWFKENLRSDNYRNGDAITGDLIDAQWGTTTGGEQAIYGNDEANLADYGRLYNHLAVSSESGLCPTGWHVPSDEDWKILEVNLGLLEVHLNDWGWRGTDEGTQLKASPNESPSWNGSNTSGYTGLPAGTRIGFGTFYDQGFVGYWWSSSFESSYAIYRGLSTGDNNVQRGYTGPADGLSVRCLKD
jgi:uncharacterized protein (TIGR02145 family)